MSQLSISNLSKRFGALQVIERFDLDLLAGDRHAVIGPNGAGKTTLFNLMSGWLSPDTGSIEVDGLNIAGQAPSVIARAGLARSFQKNTLFAGLTVAESLRLGVQAHSSARFDLFRNSGHHPDLLQRAHAIACQMELEEVFARRVNTLSYGQKRQLEVGLALASAPKILLLDEPAAGASPAERITLVRLLRSLPQDITLLLVEHDMDVVFGTCDRITVLNYGRVVASGTPEEVRSDPEVRAAYLGQSAPTVVKGVSR